MHILFFVLFTMAEIILIILTATKFRKTAAWLKNRAILSALETMLLLCIILVPNVHMKWRFFFALGLLLFRFIFNSIMWLIKRKKATDNRKLNLSVADGIVSIVLIGIALIPTLIFTNYDGLHPTGTYTVKEAKAILIDTNRTESFKNDGSFREIPVHFYYPEDARDTFPLVIFSPGAFGYYESNYSTYTELVSHGYIVAALDHPYQSLFAESANGKLITVSPNFVNTLLNIDGTINGEESFYKTKEWLAIRAEDENFVLNSIQTARNSHQLNAAWHTKDTDDILQALQYIDMEKIGLFGHSLGGATGVTLGRKRNDIDAVICLDGTMFGERKAMENEKYVYDTAPYPVPLLDLNNESHYESREKFKNDNEYLYVNEYVTENAKEARTVVFNGSKHIDFTDFPMVSPFLASKLGSGNLDHEQMTHTVNKIVLNWFDYYLKNEGTLNIQERY